MTRRWPSDFSSEGCNMRAIRSTPEPAGKPIRMVIGLLGQSPWLWACAETEAAERKSAANEPTRAFNMVVS